MKAFITSYTENKNGIRYTGVICDVIDYEKKDHSGAFYPNCTIESDEIHCVGDFVEVEKTNYKDFGNRIVCREI